MSSDKAQVTLGVMSLISKQKIPATEKSAHDNKRMFFQNGLFHVCPNGALRYQMSVNDLEILLPVENFKTRTR